MRCQAIYGEGTYGHPFYGDPHCLIGTPKYTFSGIPLGLSVRKQLGKTVIFRIQPGNGYASSKIGELYQHRYAYFVPSSITHVNGDASRSTFANAMIAWQSLTPEEKKVYKKRANRHFRMQGHNLFIREYMLSNYTP